MRTAIFVVLARVDPTDSDGTWQMIFGNTNENSPDGVLMTLC